MLFFPQEQYALFKPHVMSRSCSRWLPTHDCANECIHHGGVSWIALQLPVRWLAGGGWVPGL